MKLLKNDRISYEEVGNLLSTLEKNRWLNIDEVFRKHISKGEITRESILPVLEFFEKFFHIELKGDQLKALTLEEIESRRKNPSKYLKKDVPVPMPTATTK